MGSVGSRHAPAPQGSPTAPRARRRAVARCLRIPRSHERAGWLGSAGGSPPRSQGQRTRRMRSPCRGASQRSHAADRPAGSWPPSRRRRGVPEPRRVRPHSPRGDACGTSLAAGRPRDRRRRRRAVGAHGGTAAGRCVTVGGSGCRRPRDPGGAAREADEASPMNAAAARVDSPAMRREHLLTSAGAPNAQRRVPACARTERFGSP